jgi:hypothetical protein
MSKDAGLTKKMNASGRARAALKFRSTVLPRAAGINYKLHQSAAVTPAGSGIGPWWVGFGEPWGMRVSCYKCELRGCGVFKPVTPTELQVINEVKTDHLALPAGTEIIHAGEVSPELFTLYSGWAFRFKTLPDGAGRF